jgi:hypothetical protein
MGKVKLAALLMAAGCLPLAAQENWCSNQGWHNDGMVSHSEVREEHLAAAAQNLINPAQNGSIHVHGWANHDILVKACIQSSAPDEGTAIGLAKQVTITDGAGRVVAKGPSNKGGNAWWSVSYDVWLPASANLEMQASNGSIHVENTSGQIRARTNNGSIHLKDVGGDIDGETNNGSLTIDLASGLGAPAKALRLKTVNGSIHLQLPSTYSAEVEASTVNGNVRNDFGDAQDNKQHRSQKFSIGAGGPKIEAETVNGSVRISRQS